MGLQERLRLGIEAPVQRAAEILSEAPDADADSRLLIFLNGWFQAIATGLEEIAVELDWLRGQAFAELPDTEGEYASVVGRRGRPRSPPANGATETGSGASHEPETRRGVVDRARPNIR